MRSGETNRRLIVFVFGLTAGYLLANWNSSSPGNRDRSSIYDRQPAVDSLYSHDDDTNHKIPGLTKKYFIDCGANTASSVLLFSETYPGAKDYIIHSFEIDERLRPYFTPFKQDSNLVVHCPEGVAKYEGDQTAYLEGAWYPGKMNANKDMQWGGGTLFVSLEEREAEDGGNRKLSRRVKVPLVDLSQWIQLNTRKEDYVILKLDVEGAEYGILRKMLDDNTFEWIDKLYGEFHEWQPTEFSMEEKEILYDDMATAGVYMLKWAGENRMFEDFDRMHTSLIPQNTPGLEWDVINSCSDRLRRGVTTPVTISIKIGMNAKAARRLVETIRAFRHFVPLTLFVYGDFVEQNPKLVKDWSDIYEIGIRAGSPLPQSYWQLQNDNILRMSIVSAEFRFKRLA
ncbi:uncharacterized protein [Ptychodera flava]|uniref:uncharacterized protein n=1 Tax=Ptychodera flava TaxID=63121 RepID=UPI00396A7F44